MKKLTVVLFLSLFVFITDAHAFPTLEQLKTGLQAAAETAAGEALPAGASDIVNVLRASPQITKHGLLTWLQKKRRDAVLAGDWERQDRYQAFETCIITGDCSRAEKFTRPQPDLSPPTPSTPTPPISGPKITDPDLVITVVDKDNGKKIKDAVVQLEGDMQKAPEGVASYAKNLGILKDNTRLRMSAEAPGYEKKTIHKNVSDLKKKKDAKTNRILVRIELKKKSGQFDLKVIVTDKGSGPVSNAIVKVAALLGVKSKKAIKTNIPMVGPATIASFKLKSDLLISPDSPFFNVKISAEAPGYEPNSMKVLPSKLKSGYNSTLNMVMIAIRLKKKEGINRLEIKCAPNEIFDDEIAQCKALIHFSSGKTKDVSKESAWNPHHIDSRKGIVEGKTVKKSHTLPHPVAILAKYIAPPGDGGKTWNAKASILVKPRPSTSKPRIGLRKNSSSATVNKGDVVTYTYTITNPGRISLKKINIRDDKCAPLNGKGGDANKDGRLDPGEHWLYECSQSLNGDTVNTATVEGQDSTGRKTSASASASVKITRPATGKASDCPSGKIRVPYVIHRTETEADGDLKKAHLVGKVKSKTYSPYYKAGEIMDQQPYVGDCVDPAAVVEMVASLGPKPSQTSATPFSAKLDCGSSFELAPGGFPGRSCGIVVKGWKNTDARVNVNIAYDKSSGIEIFPGNDSAHPMNMFNPGVSDTYDRYIFSDSFRAKKTAPAGTTLITITVSQNGIGTVTLPLTVAVLPPGLPPSSGAGIRPPAVNAPGSGGKYCVWRYKMVIDGSNCFNIVTAKCDKKPYSSKPEYELVGSGMTGMEAAARAYQLSPYKGDAYGCHKKPPETDTDKDGTPDGKDKCPNDINKIAPGTCGCGIPDTDSDSDGNSDCNDLCPDDRYKTVPGTCGCGNSERDSDYDGKPDCIDICPYDNPDDKDTDGDGVTDCYEECDNDPGKTTPGLCGCGLAETPQCKSPGSSSGICRENGDCPSGYLCIAGFCDPGMGSSPTPSQIDQADQAGGQIRNNPAQGTSGAGGQPGQPIPGEETEESPPTGGEANSGEQQPPNGPGFGPPDDFGDQFTDPGQLLPPPYQPSTGAQAGTGTPRRPGSPRASGKPQGTRTVACSTTTKSGQDAPETITVNVGNTAGTASFWYNMHTVKDRMIVQYGGRTLLDTGCVSGSKTTSLSLPGGGNKVTVTVQPACEEKGTRWDFRLECPKTASKP